MLPRDLGSQVLTCEDCADARQFDAHALELDIVRSTGGAEGNSLLRGDGALGYSFLRLVSSEALIAFSRA